MPSADWAGGNLETLIACTYNKYLELAKVGLGTSDEMQDNDAKARGCMVFGFGNG